MNGFARVIQLLAPLEETAEGALLYGHIRELLDAEARARREQERLFGEMLIALVRHQWGDAEVTRFVGRVLEGQPDCRELTVLTARLRTLQLAPAVPAQSDAAEAEAEADPAAPHHEASLRYQRQLSEHNREMGEIERLLDEDIRETVRQNEEAGAVLEAVLSRLQLATEIPHIEADAGLAQTELERALAAYRCINDRLERTRESLRAIAGDTARLHEELGRVRTLSLTDELTRLANRRAFLRDLQGEIARAQRHDVPFVLVMLDLDHFKSINDVHGHAVGDEVLRAYAQRVLTVLRKQDMVARHGGEEFVALMPNTTIDGALRALEKVRKQAQSITVAGAEAALPLPTFSAGVTEYRAGDTPESLLQRADAALYQAKHRGRNRVELAEGSATHARPNEDESWRQKLLQPSRH